MMLRFVTALMFLLAAGSASAQVGSGQAAPGFGLTDTGGRRVSLADYRGKYVVLEWNNPSCPFVQKHYRSGNMQALQKRFTSEGVIWLTINSTAAAHNEFMAPAAMAAWVRQQEASPTAVLLDPEGAVGRAYGAKTTPHMYIIDPGGRLVYAGAIDDKRSTNPADVKTSNNYIVQAFAEIRAGRPVSSPATTAYGCTIKYAG